MNSNTIKDAYPHPRIDESLDQLSGSSWFSTLYLCSGYWQVEIDQEDKPKTAFATRRGLFQFNVMPFGKKVTYLGHVVSAEGVATDPAKTAAVKHWTVHTNVTEVRSFLGLCSYYRRFIKDFSSIAECLHTLTEKGAGFKWTPDCQSAFDTLQLRLTNALILGHLDFDHPFILDTDASNVSISAVLSQNIDGTERDVAYASPTLTKCERRYCVTRKELLAVVHFVKHFRHYVCGKEFVVRTDHSSLKWLFQFKNPEGQLARCLEILSAYIFLIQHRPGAQHKNADVLSRIPCRQCGFQSDWDKDEIIPLSEIRTTSENKVKTIDRDDPSFSLREKQNEDTDVSLMKNWVKESTRPDFSKSKGVDMFPSHYGHSGIG